jgi:hypothetical protein
VKGDAMRGFVGLFFMGLGFLLQFGGSLAFAGLFFFGIYIAFAKSLAIGLMIIGGAAVGSWILTILVGLTFAIGAAVTPADPEN